MKNSKNLKTALTAASIVAIFVAMIMAIIVSVTSRIDLNDPMSMRSAMPYFYTFYSDGVCVNWDFAGLYFAMLIVALGALVTKFIMFTVPAIKERTDNANIALICEILVLAGLLFAIIGLFLPEANSKDIIEVVESEVSIKDSYADRINAMTIAGWVGCPLAFIGSLGTIGLNRLAK